MGLFFFLGGDEGKGGGVIYGSIYVLIYGWLIFGVLTYL